LSSPSRISCKVKSVGFSDDIIIIGTKFYIVIDNKTRLSEKISIHASIHARIIPSMRRACQNQNVVHLLFAVEAYVQPEDTGGDTVQGGKIDNG